MKSINSLTKYLCLIAACAVTVCFWGCETINDPYYTGDPEPNVPLYADSVKKVLLEDYTGIRCNNCPEAARMAEAIATSSRQRVIVMSVHAGHLAQPIPPFTLDLRCPEGIAYFKDFGLGGTPKGLINRSQISAGIFEYSSPDWAKAVEAELKQPLTFKLKIEGSLTDNGTTINAKVIYTTIGTATTDYNLLAFLMEDGIIGMQQDGAIRDTAYIFHNVLRETLHGDAYYGIPIEKPVAGVENSYSFDNYKIKSIDKKAESSIYKLVVAITQRDSKYIEQVEEIELRL